MLSLGCVSTEQLRVYACCSHGVALGSVDTAGLVTERAEKSQKAKKVQRQVASEKGESQRVRMADKGCRQPPLLPCMQLFSTPV